MTHLSDGLQFDKELVARAVDEKKSKLTFAARDLSGWEEKYVDGATGEIWILDYPESGLHGGGPPRLRRVSPHSSS